MAQGLPIKIKTVLFDMDGVLYDSMRYHADTWVEAFRKYNIDFPEKEAYLNEGATGDATIKKAIRKIECREATQDEIAGIYDEKTRLMNQVPPAGMIPGVQHLIQTLKNAGFEIIIVTGSRQPVLLDRLKHDFGIEPNKVVSGWDVKHGKPNPEPYLIGIKKAGSCPEKSIVIENAPMGIESAVKAGIYTIAINTGPLNEEILTDAGAAKVFKNFTQIADFMDRWIINKPH
jgi:beta-phosphoglucomutase